MLSLCSPGTPPSVICYSCWNRAVLHHLTFTSQASLKAIPPLKLCIKSDIISPSTHHFLHLSFYSIIVVLLDISGNHLLSSDLTLTHYTLLLWCRFLYLKKKEGEGKKKASLAQKWRMGVAEE